MQFVFCILFFKQFGAFEKVFSKCFNKSDVHSFIISNIRPLRRGEGGKWSTPKIMYFISILILLRFFPSDLPVVLMILMRKKSKSEPKRIRKVSEQMWQTWINSFGGL
jgi:hypothetical protein